MLKSQKTSSHLNEQYHEIIDDLQNSEIFIKRINFIKENKEILYDDDKMYFRQEYFREIFETTFKCVGVSVRQFNIEKRLV